MDSGNFAPNSIHDDTNVLDVMPLRTIVPTDPSSYGVRSAVPSEVPFVYVSSSGPNFPSPVVMSNMTPTMVPNGGFPRASVPPPANVINVEDDEPIVTPHTSSSGRNIKRPGNLSEFKLGDSTTDGSAGSKSKSSRKRIKTTKADLALIPSCQDPKESVDIVLMAYDALRRRLLQLDEAKQGADFNHRPDLKAGTTLMTNNLRANNAKRIGSVPGVEVGDIFFFRMELCAIGLHAQSMGGIDTMSTKFEDGDDTVAISVVSAGGYANEDDDVDTLIYSGQGGNPNADQKLERGNLALERSLHRRTDIRVIRSAKDYSSNSGKIYVYDGLYRVQESWVDKGKTGFNVFKYKLTRNQDQPEGIAIWKRMQKWKETRGGVTLEDISSGIEHRPICVVNEVDDEKKPKHFEYITTLKYQTAVSSRKHVEPCKCLTVCLPDDDSCNCSHQNGGYLPYSSSGLLVSQKNVVYECGASCTCTISCRNRLTQKGIMMQFEIFKTMNKGWGLRSSDPIRAGTFICEFAGEVIEKLDQDGDDDDYIFQPARNDKTFKWNYGPELLGEPTADNSSESFGPLPLISAKRMGNIARFMNHSCSPNVFWQPVLHDHGNGGYSHIAFFAIRHIPPLTELTYDYGLSGGDKPKQCLCGSPKCLGTFWVN